MKASVDLRILLATIAALALGACAQEASNDEAAAPAADTAVHDAEVASGAVVI